MRRDATHLERERVTELIHELFRRVDDMFVRIDNTVRHIFQDSNYRSMLEWGRQAEKKQAAAKLAMEKGERDELEHVARRLNKQLAELAAAASAQARGLR